MADKDTIFDVNDIKFELEDNDNEKTEKLREQYIGHEPHLSKMGMEVVELERLLRFYDNGAVRTRKLLFSMGENLIQELMDYKNYIKYDLDAYKKKIYQFEKELFQISFSFENDMFTMIIPALLPHRVSQPATAFYDAVKDSLLDFVKDHCHQMDLFKERVKKRCTLMIEHSYEQARMVRDDDNVEVKNMIDLLVIAGIIPDDNGVFLEIFHTAKLESDKRCETVFKLMDKDQFKKEIEKRG